MRRRKFLQVALPAIVSLRSTQVWSRFIEQPIRMILPFAPGGSGDGLARIVAERMGAALGRTVLVENRTGGSGRIGVVAVKNAAADGRTLLITPIAPMAVYQHTYKSLGYDPIKDFAAVSQLAIFDFGLAVGSDIPVSSLKEFIAWVKADPARTAFGTASTGDLTHFLGVLFGRAANLDLRHVPYRGGAAATTDLIAGHIPSAIVPVSDLAEMHVWQVACASWPVPARRAPHSRRTYLRSIRQVTTSKAAAGMESLRPPRRRSPRSKASVTSWRLPSGFPR
jgi:tripartite-type tricarboxylate transporter receptor subunit TctC